MSREKSIEFKMESSRTSSEWDVSVLAYFLKFLTNRSNFSFFREYREHVGDG